MSEFTSGAIPGMQSPVESVETQVTWSGRHGQTLLATQKALLAADVVDSGNTPDTTIRGGNTPDTTIRGGNILAIDASGAARLYDPDANDGQQIAVGVLEHTQDMLEGGVPTQRLVSMLVHGLLKESELHGLDPRAKQQLASRFVFDRSVGTSGGELMHPRGVVRKSSNYTITPEDNGMLFIATGAVSFTLPEKANGLAFRFLQTADATMSISGSGILTVGNANASSVSASSANQKIGAHLLFECMYIAANTLRWVVSNLGNTALSIS
jgi:hypothetical protein